MGRQVEEYGLDFSQASMDREGGWQHIYRLLKSGELVICSDTCPELVKAIASRIHDKKKPGDIVKTPGDPLDDAVDALRYAVYSFIMASDVSKTSELEIAEQFERRLKGKSGAARDAAMTDLMLRRMNIIEKA